MNSLRLQRLADDIRDQLAVLFQGGRLNDPRLEPVTISAVKLSPDLQLATIYYRVYEGTDQSLAHKALVRAQGVFKRVLGDTMDLRRIPELRFFYDESIERGSRIEYLLRQVGM